MRAEAASPPVTRDCNGTRRPYCRPFLRRVELVAGEVLALGCKTALGPTGPIGASCTAIPCVDIGS